MKPYRNSCIRALPFVLAFFSFFLQAQERPVPYGANTAAGHFLQMPGARIYYETYGSGGTPLVLLHGGLYGYIDEFGDLIQEVSRHRRVIAIATRGHGRSEIGTEPFSYALFAGDALAVIRHETKDEKVDVVGFSDGAIMSYLLAGEHPELVRRLVAIGGPRGQQDWTERAIAEFKRSQPSDVEKSDPQFVADRKKLMPAPERWEEFVARVMKVEGGVVKVTDQQIRSIQAPTLIVAGDRDPYNRTEKVVEIYHLLPQGQLALIPGCGHVVLDCKPQLTIEAIASFLDKPGP
jgi:pimeloyl-ACP methyl ester carboxylesterase